MGATDCHRTVWIVASCAYLSSSSEFLSLSSGFRKTCRNSLIMLVNILTFQHVINTLNYANVLY